MVHPRILFGRQRGFKACFGVINTYIVTDLTLNVNLFVTIAFALAAIPFLRKAGANTVSSRYGRFDGQSVAGARKYGE